jgi:addiction module HigA family antidote
MATKAQVVSNLPIHPGETLVEELAVREFSQAKLARQMGRPLQTINAICTGKKSITAETALDLERVLGIAARVWLGLQAEYDETRARLARQAGPAVGKPRVAWAARGGPPAFVPEKRLRALKKAKQR